MSEKIIKLKISDLKEGMRIGKTIINKEDGKVLIKKGELLSCEKIENLKEYFNSHKGISIGTINRDDSIFEIYGESRYLPPKTSKYIKKAIDEKTQQEALAAVGNVISNVRSGEPVNAKEAEKVIENIIESIFKSEDAALNLLNIKNFDDYTYTHSVNVSTISLLIATKIGLEKKETMQLGVGALMHDLGKIKVPLEILNKNGKLTEQEFEIMKTHPVFTYEILKNGVNISDISKYIAAQHHEKFDGSGYPKKLKGENINYFARIVAVADVYDALTTDRIYRKAMLPYEAMKIIVSGSGTHFDPEIVKIFLRALSIYPVGSYVKLNTGETAIVTQVDMNHLLRPKLIIVKDGFGNDIEKIEVNLFEDKKRFITGAVFVNE